MTTTTEFYDTNSIELIKRYDNANMSSLHNLFLKYIPQNTRVLDIGFGSGRDIEFLHEKGYDTWGIDPSAKFVKNAKKRFTTIEHQFFQESVPFDKQALGLKEEFNTVITIAMWMHLQHNQYKEVVQSILSVLRSSSRVIISYSEGNRPSDERYFEEVDLEYITQLFLEQGFSLIHSVTNNDSLNRDSLTWVTVVYQHD